MVRLRLGMRPDFLAIRERDKLRIPVRSLNGHVFQKFSILAAQTDAQGFVKQPHVMQGSFSSGS